MSGWWLAAALAFAQVPEDAHLPLDDELAVPAFTAPEDAPAEPPQEEVDEPQPITFDGELVEGSETLVMLTDEFGRPERGATVQVVYGPGLYRERTEAIGITDSRGRVKWRPVEAGLAVLQAGQEERVVSVAWTTPRPRTVSALILMLFAGLFLSGYGLFPRRRRRKAT